MLIHFKIYNIKWDADGEGDLPTTIKYNAFIKNGIKYEEYLSDWLSDTYGYCHFGFDYEVIDDNENEDE